MRVPTAESRPLEPAFEDLVSGAAHDRRLEGVVRSRRRLKRLRDTRDVGLNIIPLVDVTFLLMIFFVLAGTFDMYEGVLASRLPRTRALAAVELPLTPVTLRVGRTGADGYSLSIDGIAVRPADFAELASILRDVQQKPGFDENTPVVVVADEGVRWEHVVNAWNAAVRAKYRKIVFGNR